jgi:hypothetical protein
MLTNRAIALDVLNYVKENQRLNRLMIAIGRDFPWEIDSQPPNPSPKIESLTKPLAFKLIEKIVPIYPDSKGSLVIDDTNYSLLEEVDLNQIQDNEAFKVLVEANIPHDSLSFQGFRESGIIKSTNIAPGLILSSSEVYTTRQVFDYRLEVYQTFSPVTVQSGAVSRIIMIRPFA